MSDEDATSMRCTGGWPKMRTTQNLTKCGWKRANMEIGRIWRLVITLHCICVDPTAKCLLCYCKFESKI